MCQFQSLCFSDDGYIVRCQKCNHYQVAFASCILTLKQEAFDLFCEIVTNKKNDAAFCVDENTKSITIPTPSNNVHIILSFNELVKLHTMVEAADNEIKALSIIKLFYQ